jgi:hypothetical protein
MSTSSNDAIGPTGSAEPNNNRLTVFKELLGTLFTVTDNVLRDYLNNKESSDVTYKDLGFVEDSDVEINVLNKEYTDYKKGYSMKQKDNDVVIKLYIGSFDKILSENQNVLLQAMGNDSWIKKKDPRTNKCTQVMFGDTMGKTSQFCYRLGMFYKMACVLKYDLEKKIKDYPDIIKPDGRVKYSNSIILLCFKIFKLTNKGMDSEVVKPLDIVIRKASEQLGIATQSGFMLDSKGVIDTVKPFMSVGADMLNKHIQQNNPNANKVTGNQLENVVKELFNGKVMQDIMGELQQMKNEGGTPDIGKIVGSLVTKLNPNEMMAHLQSTVEKEIPDLKKPEVANQPVVPTTAPIPINKESEKPENVEEFEEVEIEEQINQDVEEIIEESVVEEK